MNQNIIYNSEIQKMVVVLFGRDSNIYLSMIKGEKISRLIKQSLKCKGAKALRIRDKKDLFEKCKKVEQEFEDIEQKNVNL